MLFFTRTSFIYYKLLLFHISYRKIIEFYLFIKSFMFQCLASVFLWYSDSNHVVTDRRYVIQLRKNTSSNFSKDYPFFRRLRLGIVNDCFFVFFLLWWSMNHSSENNPEDGMSTYVRSTDTHLGTLTRIVGVCTAIGK